jgi:hypothetical protein
VPTGSWGGDHIALVVTDAGARVEFDCAVATIDQPLAADANGNFEARGTWSPERGGPRRIGEPGAIPHSAVYRGWTDGKQMRLTVSIAETDDTIGSFELSVGRTPSLEKCL